MDPNMFSFRSPSIIYKDFVDEFEHVFPCLEKYRILDVVLLILEYLPSKEIFIQSQ